MNPAQNPQLWFDYARFGDIKIPLLIIIALVKVYHNSLFCVVAFVIVNGMDVWQFVRICFDNLL